MERLNDILGYPNLKIYQNPDFFSFSLDSIFLANYSTIRLRDKKIVDFCTGNGVVPIILSQRCNKNIEGVEVLDKVYDLAVQSIHENHLEDRIQIYHEDIMDFSSKNEKLNTYDLVLCNPPYFKNEENSTKNLCYEKMIARHEVLISLDDVCCCAKKVLKDNGTFCIVHRSDRLMDILSSFRKHDMEPKRIKFIYETIDKESFIVLVEGQKKGNVGLKVEKPLIMYDKDGNPTEEYASLQLEVRK